MDESDDESRSLPCSNEEAKAGMPVMVQLHLVNAALEKNPQPREDFYRQYSVTPERRTPEGERTPPPPTYSPAEILRSSKAYAAKVAKGLKQFHAGRVMLRKEEAGQYGVLEEDPDYWASKIDHWHDEGWRLMKEMGRRKKLELKGEAKEGYALTMLSSPLQSNLPTLTKGQKRIRTDSEDRQEETLDRSSRTKRQRREIATAQQKQEQVPATKSTQGLGKNISKVFRTIAKEGPKGRNMPKASLTQRTLPWKLRSRVVKSYCETSTNSTKIRDHQAKKKIRPKRPGLNMN